MFDGVAWGSIYFYDFVVNKLKTVNILETPKRLAGTYRFLSQLGEGSQGTTWLAERLSDGERVAVKALKFSKAVNEKSFELFVREAEVLKSLNVKGVPKFYDLIVDESEDSSWMVQAYVDALTLQDLLDKKGKLTESLTLMIMAGVANIMIELQTKYSPAVIHRDIKPSNIMFKLEGEALNVWLIDFGAVANPQKKSGGSTIAGTFGYMAPEQLLGDVRIQSDFYALGATALHLLTGVSPVNMKADLFKLQYESVIAEHAPEVSKPMLALLARLLDTDIANRPVSAEQLKQEIDDVRQGRMPLAGQTKRGFGEQLRLRWRGFVESRRVKERSVVVSSRAWMKAEGIIHTVTENSDSWLNFKTMTYNYTFDVDGKTWSGKFKRSSYQPQSKRVPRLCNVVYDPRDPRYNCLEAEAALQVVADQPARATRRVAKRKDDEYVNLQLANASTRFEVQYLLMSGADVNSRDSNGIPIICRHAERLSDPDIFELFYEAGLDVNARLSNGDPLITYFSIRRNLKLVKLLIEHGFDVNARLPNGDPLITDLWILDDMELLKLLIDHGCDVNACLSNGEPLITHLRVRANYDLVKFFIEHGFDVNARKKSGNLLITDYCNFLKENLHFVKLFIKNGFDVNARLRNGNPLILAYGICENLELMKMIVEHGFDVNARLSNGEPLLTHNLICWNLEVVKLFIEHGFDVNARLSNGEPLLTHNLICERLVVVELLIEHGFDVNARLSNGEPLLTHPCISRNDELVNLLILHGADLGGDS